MADTALVPYDMGTFGSRTTPTMAPQVRRAAATAREVLRDLAAERWQIDRAKVSIVDGKVSGAGIAAPISFGELTKGQKLTRSVNRDVTVARPVTRSVPKSLLAISSPTQIHARPAAPRHVTRPRAASAGIWRHAR